MSDVDALVDQLRRRILNRLHLQAGSRGDRLPGIRELSKELDADHRAVARAYRVLEEEGLVEVRGRAGVFLAYAPPPHQTPSLATHEWLTGVLTGARHRGIALTDLPGLLSPTTRSGPLRCACFEGNLDQLVAHSWELQSHYGLATMAVNLNDRAAAHPRRLQEVVERCDLLFTTLYWSHLVEPLAESSGKPLVIVRVDPDAVRDLASLLDSRLEQAPLTVIVADPRFADVLRSIAGSLKRPERLRYVVADDRAAIAALDPAESVVLTRAARDRLPAPHPPVFLFHAPVLSSETIHRLCGILLELKAKRG